MGSKWLTAGYNYHAHYPHSLSSEYRRLVFPEEICWAQTLKIIRNVDYFINWLLGWDTQCCQHIKKEVYLGPNNKIKKRLRCGGTFNHASSTSRISSLTVDSVKEKWGTFIAIFRKTWLIFVCFVLHCLFNSTRSNTFKKLYFTRTMRKWSPLRWNGLDLDNYERSIFLEKRIS